MTFQTPQTTLLYKSAGDVVKHTKVPISFTKTMFSTLKTFFLQEISQIHCFS